MDRTQVIVVSGALVHQGKILIVQRSQDSELFPGYYELPGGKLEFGEDPMAGLIREFQEETNLIINPFAPFRTFSYFNLDQTKHYVEIVYLVDLAESEEGLQTSEEHADHKWITYDQLQDYVQQMSSEVETNIQMAFELTVPDEDTDEDHHHIH